jgi:hypothetical protein
MKVTFLFSAPAFVEFQTCMSWPTFFDAVWTPTVLLLDSEGKERVRLEGYLPNNDFVAALMSGRGRIAFVQKKYSDAERWYGDVGARFANSHFARRRTATETQVISRKRARRSSPLSLTLARPYRGFAGFHVLVSYCKCRFCRP